MLRNLDFNFEGVKSQKDYVYPNEWDGLDGTVG